MESDSTTANWHAMNRHFPCSAMINAGGDSTQHHCLRGDGGVWNTSATHQN